MAGSRVGFTRAAQRATQASDRLCLRGRPGCRESARRQPAFLSFDLGRQLVPTLLCGGVLF